MKNIYFSCLLAFLISCGSQPDLGGLWYADPGNHGEYRTEFTFDECTYFAFEDDLVIRLSDSRLGRYVLDTIPLVLGDTTWQMGHTSFLFDDYGDSLMLTSLENEYDRILLKKINPDRQIESVDKRYFSGTFNLHPENQPSFRKLEFLNDSIVQHNWGWCSGYPFSRWSIFKFKGFSFLDGNSLFPLILIESCSDDSIIMTNPMVENERYILERITKKRDHTDLIGTWTSSDYEHELEINEHTLELKPTGEERIWTIDFEGRSIYFPYHYPDYYWSLSSLSLDRMKLEVYDTTTNQTNTIKFIKD